MFELDQTTMTLSNKNDRPEYHGDQIMRACDLSFKGTMPNTVLDMFDDELRSFLYEKVDPEEADLADQGMDEDYLSKLRFPLLKKKQDWDWKGAGYRLCVFHGIDDKEPSLIFVNVDLDKFKFEAKQGGSVDIEFQAKVYPSNKEAGALFGLLGTDVDLSLEPPSAEQLAQMDIDEDDDHYGYDNGVADWDDYDEKEEELSEALNSVDGDNEDDEEEHSAA